MKRREDIGAAPVNTIDKVVQDPQVLNQKITFTLSAIDGDKVEVT